MWIVEPKVRTLLAIGVDCDRKVATSAWVSCNALGAV